jgi:putative transposase
MPKKRFSAEQIVTLLRQIEVSMGQGNSTQIAYREAGISEQSSETNCSTERSSTV